jgi:hypothetical protein
MYPRLAIASFFSLQRRCVPDAHAASAPAERFTGVDATRREDTLALPHPTIPNRSAAHAQHRITGRSARR